MAELNTLESKHHAVVMACSKSRVPYSHRASGACLATDQGTFSGVAIEYCNYTNSICAPMAAVLTALAAGASRFDNLEVYTPSSSFHGGEPCGRCLEFLSEYCPKTFPIVVVKGSQEESLTSTLITLGEMLPATATDDRGNFRNRSKPSALVLGLVENVSSLKFKLINPGVMKTPIALDLVQQLCRETVKSCQHAYIPVSEFPVGAAVLDEQDRIITGVNVEHSIIGLGSCAERTALARAISNGSRKFKAIAVVLPNTSEYGQPCGACRQSLVEFGNYTVFQIKIINNNLEVFVSTTLDLLPHAFSPEALS